MDQVAGMHNNNMEFAKRLCAAAESKGFVRDHPDVVGEKEYKASRLQCPWQEYV